MQLPKADRRISLPRTLESLDTDYNNFTENGGNIKDAKFYNNVIDTYMFNIPIDQVRLFLTDRFKVSTCEFYVTKYIIMEFSMFRLLFHHFTYHWAYI